MLVESKLRVLSQKQNGLKPDQTIKTFHPTSCWKKIFHCLAIFFNFTFKWFSNFDLYQAFSPNILPTNFWSFSHLYQQGLHEREKETNQKQKLGDVATSMS